MTAPLPEGILLVNKPEGKTSFSLVHALRRILKVQKIGHAGTLDPLATGVMVMMVGKNYTKRSNEFLCNSKEYLAEITLGASTDTYDSEGVILQTSTYKPSKEEVLEGLKKFQGEFKQTPPMFSAKKVQGKKLYDLAREGKEIEREASLVFAEVICLKYDYPKIHLRVKCSKGTYIRSIAHDLGMILGSYAHLTALQRTRSGHFELSSCIDGNLLFLREQEENAKNLICNALITE